MARRFQELHEHLEKQWIRVEELASKIEIQNQAIKETEQVAKDAKEASSDFMKTV